MKKLMKKSMLCVVMLLAVACLAACGKTEISLNEYVTATYTGYNGSATAEISIDYKKLLNEHEEEIGADNRTDVKNALKKIEFKADKTENLFNGDKISVEMTVDEERFAELGFTPVYSAVEIEVADLKTLDGYDIFKGIEFVFEGYDGYGRYYMNSYPDTEYRYDFEYKYDENVKIKNGDTFTVEAVPYDNTLEEMAAAGYKPVSLKYDIKVSGLTPIMEINPFDYAVPVFSGDSTKGYVYMTWNEGTDSRISNHLSFNFDKDSGLCNGDKIKATVSSWYGIDSDEFTSNTGLVLTATEQEIEVTGLKDILRSASEISEENLEAMKTANIEQINTFISENWTEPSALREIAYLGNVIISDPDGSWSGPTTDVYMLYKFDVKSTIDGDMSVYWYNRYSNVYNFWDGTLSIDPASSKCPSTYNNAIKGIDDINKYVGFADYETLIAEVTGDNTVLENNSADVEITRVPDTAFRTYLAYTTRNNRNYNKYGDGAYIEITADGTYTLELDLSNTPFISGYGNAFEKLNVYFKNIGESNDLSGIKISDIAVLYDGAEVKVAGKKAKRGFIDELPGNADSYILNLIYDKDIDGDGNIEASAVAGVGDANIITVTFTITGITSSPDVQNTDGTETSGSDNTGDGAETAGSDNTGDGAEASGEAVNDGESVITENPVETDGESVTENTVSSEGLFDVQLVSSNDSKLAVIKAVRELTGLGLMEAKNLTESAPAVILSNVSAEAAKNAVAAIEEAGGTVELIQK